MQRLCVCRGILVLLWLEAPVLWDPEFGGGQLSGVYQEWYENSRSAAEGQYTTGEKEGLWRY